MIHILLPAHNRRAITERFAKSLAAQTSAVYHLVLIDDGSTDGTAEAVRALIPEATVIRGKGDWWWGGSLHQGYLWARSASLAPEDIVMLVNDDTVLDPQYLENAQRSLEARPGDLLVSSARDESGRLQEQRMKVDWLRLRFRPVREGEEPDWCTTRGLCMRASEFLSIGGFYPRALPHYLSDVEYTLRARRKGHRIFADPAVSLLMNTETTGNHVLASGSMWSYMKTIFSKRTSHNPVYMTSFLFLAAPAWAILPGMVKVWMLPLVEYLGFRRGPEAS